MTIKEFAKMIAPIIHKNAEAKKIPEYLTGIIIAQAWFESGNYSTELATKHFNLFNLKATLMWKGKFIAVEEDGTTKVKKAYASGTFKGFKSLEDGVAEYFKLISSPRYSNIKKSQDAKDYLEKLKADGYKLKDDELTKVIKVYETYKLDEFDYSESNKAAEDLAKKETKVSNAIKDRISKTVAPTPTVKKTTPDVMNIPKQLTGPKNAVNPNKPSATTIKPKVVNNTPVYFEAYKGSSNSIISALLSMGCNDTTTQFREELARINNVPLTPDFNIKLLNLLKEGKLRRR